MENESNENKPSRWHKIYYIFGVFMVLFYVGMAYIMIFSPIFVERISPAIRYGMGALFLVYGVFRGYRQVRDMKDRQM